MNVGIDLGTTNSALAYIDPHEAAEAEFPPIHVLPVEQQIDANRTGTLRTLPSFLYLSDPPVARRLCARSRRPAAYQDSTFGEVVAVKFGSGSHRQDSALGFAGRRPRSFARRSLRPLSFVPRGYLAEDKDFTFACPASGSHCAGEL